MEFEKRTNFKVILEFNASNAWRFDMGTFPSVTGGRLIKDLEKKC